MSHGKITLKGTPETLFKIPEKLVENNLELPFEVALIDDLRKKKCGCAGRDLHKATVT